MRDESSNAHADGQTVEAYDGYSAVRRPQPIRWLTAILTVLLTYLAWRFGFLPVLDRAPTLTGAYWASVVAACLLPLLIARAWTAHHRRGEPPAVAAQEAGNPPTPSAATASCGGTG
jgi:hypothetical protein